MSAPNMVPVLTDMEILHAAADFSIEEPPGTLAGFEAGARYGRSFARRRALAELRALKDQFDNEDAQNDDNATGLTEACGIVRKRIAEIEAEEA